MSLRNSVSAILSLLFMVPISLVPALALLHFYVSTFRSMCAVPNMAVFCSSITSWFPGMLLMYFLNDFEMVPVAHYWYHLVSTDFGTCSYQCFLSSCTPVSLHMLKCSWAVTLSCLFVYCSFAIIGHADIMWSIVSTNCWQSLHLLSVSVLNIFVA